MIRREKNKTENENSNWSKFRYQITYMFLNLMQNDVEPQACNVIYNNKNVQEQVSLLLIRILYMTSLYHFD